MKSNILQDVTNGRGTKDGCSCGALATGLKRGSKKKDKSGMRGFESISLGTTGWSVHRSG